MAAGVTSDYDRSGTETAHLIKSQWPAPPVGARAADLSSTASQYGRGVRCHAAQSYRAPSVPAGTSKRMGVFYERNGALQPRTEAGFRDTRGRCTLTEIHQPGYGSGTLRKTGARLSGAGSTAMLGCHGTFVNNNTQNSSGLSRRSCRSVGSAHSSKATTTPGPAIGTTTESATAPPPMQLAEQQWNYGALPTYGKTSEMYGKDHAAAAASQQMRPAGKSDSGFIEPSKLVATLTKY